MVIGRDQEVGGFSGRGESSREDAHDPARWQSREYSSRTRDGKSAFLADELV